MKHKVAILGLFPYYETNRGGIRIICPSERVIFALAVML